MNMKCGKLVSLLLILSLMAPLTLVAGGGVHGKNTLTMAMTSPIALGLGDSVTFGNYTVQFYDINSNWSIATIALKTNGSERLYFLSSGQTAYYPSKGNCSIAIKLVRIVPSAGEVYVAIGSPVRPFREGLTMVPNSTVVINSLTSIRLDGTFTNGAVFTVMTGTLTKLNMSQGTSANVSCKLPSGVTYSNCLIVHLKSVSSSGNMTVIDVYTPVTIPVPFHLKRVSAANRTSEKKTVTVPYVPAYSGYMYGGDKLKISYNGTVYVLELVNVSDSGVKISVTWNNESELLQIPVGTGIVGVKNVPVMLNLKGVDTMHSRALLTVLTPEGASTVPPFHPADVTVSISASPRTLLLGQKIVVVINVRNNGPGDAKDLSVAAPVPNNFKLISSSKVWMMKVLPAFSSMPALVYVLEPTSVGNFSIGQATVVYTSNGTKTIKSRLLGGIKVYSIPQIDVRASTKEVPVTLNGSGTFPIEFRVSAVGSNPNYEFVKDAKLILEYPSGLSGPSTVYLGTIKAGESVSKEVSVHVSGKGLYTVKAYLQYTDPVGNQHTLQIGYVAAVDSIPPKVIVKTKIVKVYPTGKALVSYVNQTLKSGNSTALAKELQAVIKPYLPKKVNYWIPIAIVFIVLTGAFVYETARYRREVLRLRRKIERRRKPGGLPKKEDEEQEMGIKVPETKIAGKTEPIVKEKEKTEE